MQQPQLPDRDEADASLISFFSNLGHRPPSTLAFRTSPRLSDTPVHAGLSRTVDRLRRATPEAAMVRPIRRARRVAAAPRIAIMRAKRLRDRGFDALAMSTIGGIVIWIGLPVAAAAVAGVL